LYRRVFPLVLVFVRYQEAGLTASRSRKKKKTTKPAAFTTATNRGDQKGRMTEDAVLPDSADASRMRCLHHLSGMQRVRAVTSHAAAYVQRWWCGPDGCGHHTYVPGSGSVAPAEPEFHRVSARMLITAGRGPARVPTCEQALRDARTKFYHLVDVENEDWFLTNSFRYDLRFEEWHDDYDVKTRALRNMRLRTARVDDLSPVLMRALSLFGPGELRALRVLDVAVFRLVASLLPTASSSAPQIEQAIDALCAVQVGGSFAPSPDIGSLSTLLKRHSATITEFDAELSPTMLKEAASALACCTRLESLTRAHFYNPAVWLGLSQLHTLRGVDLGKVSFAVIAAALPKLHTLTAFGGRNPAQVAGFFTDLLPRLRVFRFSGKWPAAQEQPASIVAPLPLLQELVWDLSDGTTAPREFLGAQPTVLHAPYYALISQCWLGGVEEAAPSFLARVRDMRVTTAFDAHPLDPAHAARVLRGAPQLKKFYTDRCMQDYASWLAPTAPTHPAFEGLVHPRLREFGVRTAHAAAQRTSNGSSPDDGWAAHLRHCHFPRLRVLAVNKAAYFVTPSECPFSRETDGTIVQ
jgi:hypothetical protein